MVKHNAGKENKVAYALSNRSLLVATTKYRMGGFKHLKEMHKCSKIYSRLHRCAKIKYWRT
jgi:hypothetical protein